MPALARRRVLMSPAAIERAVSRMAHQIIEPEEAQSGLVVIGIRRGGEALARRLVAEIAAIAGEAPGLGFLNINLYRDDDVARELPESEIRSDIAGKTVVIVDDVLYTGRTVRAALDAVTDLGRPRAIRLAVLVDRGLRELPVQADYIGKTIPTSRREHIDVVLAPQPSADDSVALVLDEERAAT
ncbi:MAG: bifunctional pyr operon transcriptional regulator/uracil phosphoribosyltransferase PyrR [Candidatus Lustribacter sp.]